jgi:tRNA U34 5-carboxymethylaminomethyl modifying GTPase MnmE/TrmE
MTSAFRTVFHFQEHVNWFPGHMLKSMRELSERLSQCHAVLEVRDARLPFSSANPSLHSIIQGKKRVIYFNKADLIEPAQAKMIKSRIDKSSAATTRCLFGSTLETSCASSILRELNAAVSTNESAPSIDKSIVDHDRVTYSAKPSVFLPNKSAQSQNGMFV